MAKNTIEVKLLGDNKDLTKALDDSSSKIGRWASNVAKVAAVAVAGVAVAGVAFGKKAYDAAIESQKIGAQTEAVIKSMGLQATVTSGRIGDLAESLSLKNAVDDEAIQTGQNLLLTFANLASSAGTVGGVFDRTSQVMIDMGAAMGTDASASAIQLGKALNDPIKGITALTRVGVSFTEQQKEQIKSMTESGDIAGAQALILSELERQFGGSAAAQATAADRMKIAFGNLQERIGKFLIPIVEKLSLWLTDKAIPALTEVADRVMPRLQQVVGTVAEFIERHWGDVTNVIAGTVEVVRTMVDFFKSNQPALIGLIAAIAIGFTAWAVSAGAAAVATLAAAAPVIAVVAAIGLLVAGLVYAYQNWETFRVVVDAVVAWLVDVAWPAIQTATAGIVEAFSAVADWTQENWPKIRAVIEATLNAIRIYIETVIAVIRAAWETWGETLVSFIADRWESIKAIVQAAIDIVRGIIQTVTALIKGDWQGAWDGIKLVLSGAWDALKTLVQSGIDAVKLILQLAWDAVGGYVSDTWSAIAGFVADGIDDIIGYVAGIPGRVGSAIGDGFEVIWTKFKSVANRIIDGWNGLEFSIPPIDIKIPGVPSIPGFSVGTPNIPRLASGGVLTSPTFALLGEYAGARSNPEITAPRSMMVDAVGEALDRRDRQAPITLQIDTVNDYSGDSLSDAVRTINTLALLG